jgi:quinol monooxygenase YgiN
MYVVTVEFTVLPKHAEAFLREMRANAHTSRTREPGCRQFDVCVAPEGDSRVFLYEVYDDRAAFEAHLASPHFKAFDARVAPWVAGKSVRTYARVEPA